MSYLLGHSFIVVVRRQRDCSSLPFAFRRAYSTSLVLLLASATDTAGCCWAHAFRPHNLMRLRVTLREECGFLYLPNKWHHHSVRNWQPRDNFMNETTTIVAWSQLLHKSFTFVAVVVLCLKFSKPLLQPEILWNSTVGRLLQKCIIIQKLVGSQLQICIRRLRRRTTR